MTQGLVKHSHLVRDIRLADLSAHQVATVALYELGAIDESRSLHRAGCAAEPRKVEGSKIHDRSAPAVPAANARLRRAEHRARGQRVHNGQVPLTKRPLQYAAR